MKSIWVILTETKDAIVEVFETESPDSKTHWDKFFQFRAGCVFCARTETKMSYSSKGLVYTESVKWYVNYFYWEDTARWGMYEPDGIGWSACLALPEPIKMVEMIGGL